MTLTPPPIAPVTVTIPDTVFRSVPDIQPFTYRSGMTYTKLLESMRAWLYNTLVPYLNANFEDLQGSWTANVTAISTAVDTALADQATTVANSLATTLQEITSGANAALNDAAVLNALEVAASTSLAYLDGRYLLRSSTQVYNVRLDYGAVGNGTADDTAAIQTAINAARDAVRTSAMGVKNTVLIPAGKYKITSTLVVPPYVKLRAAGTVILSWAGTGSGPVLWVAPLADDPDPLYTPVQKQQWENGPILNGTDGGFILLNAGPVASVGIESGSRSDLSGKQLSRYSYTDYAIQGFGTAELWNQFNHFIGHRVNAHIENNSVAVQIGTNGANGSNINSGENFSFERSVIAGATTAVMVNTYGFDVTYLNCSVDFITTNVINLKYGYGRHAFIGGHIENVNPSNAAGGGIVNSTSNSEVHVHFDSTTILCNAAKQFTGTNLYLSGNAEHWHYDTETQVNTYRGPVLADDAVSVEDFSSTHHGWRRLFSRNTNLIDDPTFTVETVGSKSSLVNWVVAPSAGVSYSIVADSPETGGGNSLHITIPSGGYIALTAKNSIQVVDKRARYSGCGFYTDTVGVNIAADLEFHDWGDVARDTAGTQTFAFVNTAPANQWLFPSYLTEVANPGLFVRYPRVRPTFIFSNPTGGTINIRVPWLYFGR